MRQRQEAREFILKLEPGQIIECRGGTAWSRASIDEVRFNQYHAIVETMSADCMKRNKLALHARRAIILPAVIAQDINISGLSEALGLLNQPRTFSSDGEAKSLFLGS